MADVDAITRLLSETEQAHGVFEGTVLNGVHDQAWAQWYAAYALEHGLGELLGHPVTVDVLATFLAESWDLSKQADPGPNEPWAGYTAGRLAARRLAARL